MRVFFIADLNSGANIDGLISGFNGSQAAFVLRRSDISFQIADNKPLDAKQFFAATETFRQGNEHHVIGITSQALKNNFFSQVDQSYNAALISTDQSDLYSPQFSVEDYLQEETLLCVLLMLSKMDIGHYDTRGCLFDFCEDKRDIPIKMYTGSICADCRARLVYYGVDDDAIVASQRVLWRVSRDFHSGKVNRGCPLGHAVCQEYQAIQNDFVDSNIFFATSFRDEYLDMADHLRSRLKEVGFNLKVVSEDITNKSILCKICKTMQTCKFGIAEFSGLRHNVSYEFGLMQAFGLQSIAVMRESKFQDFEKEVSDMKGIEVIRYRKVLGDLFDRITAFVGATAEQGPTTEFTRHG